MTVEEFSKLESGITYENIQDYIDKVFPEYLKSKDCESYSFDRELRYVYLTGLCNLALEDLDNRSNVELAEALVKFSNVVINRFGDCSNFDKTDNLDNLFGIEVFELLTGSKKGIHMAKEYLSDRALETFHLTIKHYHTDESLIEYHKVFGY